MDAQRTWPMTLKQWFYEFGDEPFDYIDGEKIIRMPSVSGVSFTAGRLYEAFDDADQEHSIGRAYIGVSLVYLDERDQVRRCLLPNIAFFSTEKLAAFRAKYPTTWKELPLMVIPEIVVEIISPTDLQTDVRRKVKGYQAEGVPLIWLVDFMNEVIEVFDVHGAVHELRRGDTLMAGDIIPGFELTLETLFT